MYGVLVEGPVRLEGGGSGAEGLGDWGCAFARCVGGPIVRHYHGWADLLFIRFNVGAINAVLEDVMVSMVVVPVVVVALSQLPEGEASSRRHGVVAKVAVVVVAAAAAPPPRGEEPGLGTGAEKVKHAQESLAKPACNQFIMC